MGHGWRGLVGAGTLIGLLYVLVAGTLLREALWIVALAMTCAAMVIGLRTHRPARTHPWVILLSAFVLLTISYLLKYPVWVTAGTELISNVFTLVSYPLIAVASLTMVRVQAPGGDREGAIDGTIVMIAMATLLSGTAFNPSNLDADADALARLLLVVAPLLLSAVTAATFRLLFVGSANVPSAWMLVSAAVGALTGNVARTVLMSQGAYERGMWVDLFLLASYIGAAVAALHPSMVRLTEPTKPGKRRLTFARLSVLGASLVAAPATLVVQEPGVGMSMPILSSVALSLLVLWRLGHLVVERETARQTLHDRAERLDALTAIGLKALDDPDLAQLHDEVTRGCTELLELRTCDVRPKPSTTPSDAMAVPIGAGSGEVLLAAREQPWTDEDITFLQAVANVLAGAHERHASQEAARHQALHDSLTGLPNRVLLLDRIDHALAQARRTHDTVGVLFIDLDGFKRINDDHGHQAGDDFLKLVAESLRQQVRDADTVGRLAGDEFVVVCERTDQPTARAVADRIIDALRTSFELPCGPVRVGASIGLALAEAGIADPERLLGDADIAMYLAKEQIGSAVVVFDQDVGATRERRRRLEGDLPGAIERDELELVYQPLSTASPASTDTGVVGVAALLRWSHPDLGTIPPAEFLPIADGAGLTRRVGDWVVDESASQLARWTSGLSDAEPFTVWISLSPRQLADADLPDRVRARLDDLGVLLGRIGFRLPETALLDEDAIPTVASLHALGVGLTLDDVDAVPPFLTHLARLAEDLTSVDAVGTPVGPPRPAAEISRPRPLAMMSPVGPSSSGG